MIATLSAAATAVAGSVSSAGSNPFDFSWVASPEAWVALVTLALLEIVLGIDNIVFISILVDKLPEEQRPRGRFLGLALAMVTRILLLLSITWVMKLTNGLFSMLGHDVTGKDLVLIIGGLFLIWKSTHEIHEKLEGDPEGEVRGSVKTGAAFGAVLVQIALLDIVFSLDSVITAVGMAQQISIMVLAVLLAVGFMMVFAGAVSNFVNKHPTVKMLALSFLLMIGTALIGEGLGFHIPKGYIYFAMGFSVMVELFNLKAKRASPDRREGV
jgi:predicted tellurium resistance membrane protein TerC